MNFWRHNEKNRLWHFPFRAALRFFHGTSSPELLDSFTDYRAPEVEKWIERKKGL